MIIKDVIDSHIKSFFEYIEQRKLKIGDFLSLIYKAFYYIKMTETKNFTGVMITKKERNPLKNKGFPLFITHAEKGT